MLGFSTFSHIITCLFNHRLKLPCYLATFEERYPKLPRYLATFRIATFWHTS
jgi:hypothetical protein